MAAGGADSAVTSLTGQAGSRLSITDQRAPGAGQDLTCTATLTPAQRDAVGFQVIDSLDGDSARGDYAGPIPGVVRPILHWTTEYRPAA